jgi:hypothetical protein
VIVIGVFLGIFALVSFAFALVDPRRVWRRFPARRFENPGAPEPSAAVRFLLRVTLLSMAIGAAWHSADSFRLAEASSGPDHDEVVERMESAAESLRSGGARRKYPLGKGAWGEYLKEDLRRPGEDVVATLVSKSGNTERYEAEGVCLTVIAEVLPGEPQPKYAHIDDRHYSLKTDVRDSPCT